MDTALDQDALLAYGAYLLQSDACYELVYVLYNIFMIAAIDLLHVCDNLRRGTDFWSSFERNRANRASIELAGQIFDGCGQHD